MARRTVTRFESPIVYEDYDASHTARWKLTGFGTREENLNNDRGWLWMTTVKSGDNVTVTLYEDAAGSSSVAASSATDVSGIADADVKVTLSATNSSGLSGELYFIGTYAADDALVPVCVSLCSDADLELLVRVGRMEQFVPDIYSPTDGMARWCSAATTQLLMRLTQMFPAQLGGYGVWEHRHLEGASRDVPRLSRLSNPEQLREIAAHWAVGLAMGAQHQQVSETTWQEARDYHLAMRDDLLASLNLTFTTNPDSTTDADQQKSAAMIPITRL